MKNKFANAGKGILAGMRHKSILAQMIFGICALIAGVFLQLAYLEWCVVVLCIGCVIASEMLNTCIEKLCDMYSLEYLTDIKIIKDIAAGAVFFAAMTAIVIGLIIYVPIFF